MIYKPTSKYKFYIGRESGTFFSYPGETKEEFSDRLKRIFKHTPMENEEFEIRER